MTPCYRVQTISYVISVIKMRPKNARVILKQVLHLFPFKGGFSVLDIALVMPVYNEEACIVEVVNSWRSMLTYLSVQFRIIVLNDGSNDGTAERLQVFAQDKNIEVVNKKNMGHGPTILMGYRKALQIACWVFQCDSDDEIKADSFPKFWKRRNDFDALVGNRADRKQNTGRKFISICSRISVSLLFGRKITDVNIPFRLIRSEILEMIIDKIPDNTFAPNVLISGALSKAELRIFESPVYHSPRKTGKVSIVKWKLWKSAFKSFWQIICYRF